ncbi:MULTISPECIES: hypothetical protein [Clostridium]|jgi:hypothetical protein|uniref:Uncharacterized protein n=1 Tax=Clostridium tertium TaxID=1559 RepID=A0A9X4AZW8_9CLOT|nr:MULTISPECIES: hypothetical protein [Clostridium]MDB1934632.1 hypothetical protein [Clostridium tertium]MDB1937879.1 hypothetical protein [Clostridium tertium]MDB1941439.1 hypothetical protein [Clostridium tertium]MDC4240294.1 hypothetical protein [Clostridium tertium]MDU6362330.1 hypothetical protein [Clostridium sp.]
MQLTFNVSSSIHSASINLLFDLVARKTFGEFFNNISFILSSSYLDSIIDTAVLNGTVASPPVNV